MRTESGTDTNISQSQFPNVTSIHPYIWMVENGPYQLPQLAFHPIIDGTIALVDIEFHRGGHINYGTIILPEERTDLPENELCPDRYEFPQARFELTEDGSHALWTDEISSFLKPIIMAQEIFPGERILLGNSFEFRGRSYTLNKVENPNLISLDVEKISPNNFPFKVFESAVNLTFPLGIEPTDLDWLIENRRNLRTDLYQEMAAERLHFSARLS